MIFRSILPGSCLSLVLAGTAAATQAAAISSQKPAIFLGELRAEINADGAIVGCNTSGLRAVDGPKFTIEPGFSEWYSLSFDGPGGHVERAGCGLEADWAGRARVDRVSIEATSETITVETRAGEMQIRTEFRFDPLGPYLLGIVTLTNTSGDWLHNVFYSREWMQAGEGWTFPPDLPAHAGAPQHLARRLWMSDDIGPSKSFGVVFSFEGERTANVTSNPVPLALWTSPAFPSGLDYGATNGISFGDYDSDGYIDVFCCQSARLWRNLSGAGWQLAATLTNVLPAATFRYGSSFGDYDNDGLPDIVTEPRNSGGNSCMHLLHNLGGGPNFADVATNPAIIDLQACASPAESDCWGDVDGDGNLDNFLPVYPGFAGGPGNFFYFNQGPVGPGGAYAFNERSGPAGLDNPGAASRPEGAQFCDYDFDGDIDLYSNGTVYQNRSLPHAPDFDNITPAGSGINLSSVLEEGAAFADYDRDGDYDILLVYSSSPGVRIWESYGDGSFFAAEPSVVDSPLIGLDLGLSAEDWDMDGDIDFTTRQVFRRNQLVESGTRHFTVQTTNIPANFISSATPAWGDWDKDGDLDCALGNWTSTGHFYENRTYVAAMTPDQRRFVRVRPLRDSGAAGSGIETEFGADVRVSIAGEPSVRRKFTASSAGYLNQNEYTLTFALPIDPDPDEPSVDIHFDVSVDFKGAGPLAFRRIDKRVNQHLGGIELATLTDREITVFRSGLVKIGGVLYEPDHPQAALIITTTGGLSLPGMTTALPAPIPVGPNTYVGTIVGAKELRLPLHVEEILIDGQLASPVIDATGDWNIGLWDVTDQAAPFLTAGNRLVATTSVRNRRSYIPCDLRLEPGHIYRLVAHVAQLRATFVNTPLSQGQIQVLGGFSYIDADPSSGQALMSTTIDNTRVYTSMRLRL